MSPSALERGMAALEAGRWEEARDGLQAVLDHEESPEVLLGLADAVWWLGGAPEAVELMERAYAGLRQAGEVGEAAQTAAMLAVIYKKTLGNQAAASGWVARASRLAGPQPPAPSKGWLLWAKAIVATDPASSEALAREALACARGDDGAGDAFGPQPDLELCALSVLGDSLVALGRVEEGLELVDEAMAGVVGGECDSRDAITVVVCSMMLACDRVADLARLRDWCRVADRFMEQFGCLFLYADCRSRYGSVLLAQGHWSQAERELEAAMQSAPSETDYYAVAACRLALLRLGQGRLAEAASLVQQVADRPCALPVLAAVRFAQGERAVCAALLERWLAAGETVGPDAPAALGLLVETCLAMGDGERAGEALDRLERLAGAGQASRAAAHAHLAAGRIAAHAAAAGSDRSGEAERLLVAAMDGFAACGLPHETALARLALAEVLAGAQPEVARSEAEGAFSALDRLGARPAADAAAALARSLGGAARPGPKSPGVLTRREQDVLQLLAEGLSNPEIAARLYISRKTASHHVSRVLTKLGLRNRAEAAAYAATAAPGG